MTPSHSAPASENNGYLLRAPTPPLQSPSLGRRSSMLYPPCNTRRIPGLLAYSALASLVLASAHASLTFNLGTTGNANADAGFQRAASYLSSKFSDNLTLNITTGFNALGSGILGQTGSTSAFYGFTNWKNAIAADKTTAADLTFSSSLPISSSFSLYLNRTANNPNGAGSATPYLDNDGDANNTTLNLSNSNAKALGLLSATNSAADASITFSSAFNFDFDPSDGITAGAYDFVGVATHEIMHAMGFVSGVDILDGNSTSTFYNDNAFTYVTGLDFTRQSTASIAAGANIDWTADTRAKAYSINLGGTLLVPNAWSTGTTYGDGRQASHWKDNLGLGIMDPTAAPGELLAATALDLQALDVIGWNLTPIPEPGTYAFYGVFTAFALGFVVHRHRAGKTITRVV